MKLEFGMPCRDKITGFEGVVVGFASYISGCAQALVQPRMGEDRKRPEGEWFDVQRLERMEGEVITLDNGVTPGADKAAPKR